MSLRGAQRRSNLHLFYILSSDVNLEKATAILSREEWKHASKVLRLKVGDFIEFFDGNGRTYKAKIIDSQTKAFNLQIFETQQHSSDYSLSVFVGLPKGRKIDLIINALTQIGATTIGTFTSQYSIAKAGAEKEERLRKIAIEACKQSGRAWIPKIKNAINFEDLLDITESADKTVVFYEKAPLYQSLNLFKAKNIAIVIGPEGGFAKPEIDMLTKNGAFLSRLSDGILRVEIAAIVAAQLARYTQLT